MIIFIKIIYQILTTFARPLLMIKFTYYIFNYTKLTNPITQKRIACLDLHSPIYLKTKNDKFCGGDISDLYQLIDKASRAGFSLLQLTPLQDTGYNPSPYMGISIFSLSPIFLSLAHLKYRIDYSKVDLSLLEKATSHKLDRVSFRNLYKFKVAVLRLIFEENNLDQQINFTNFDHNVLVYAMFKALKNKFDRHWIHWPQEFKEANIRKILIEHPSLHHEIKFHLFVQETLLSQWLDLAKYAKNKRVDLMLDKPIYPIHDSANVWANQSLFYLKKDGSLKYASGCNNPNDPFGPQYWGHAVYKFKQKPKEVVTFYIKSTAFLTQIANTIRLDHTLALIWKYYIIKPDNKIGKHVSAIKQRLFKNLLESFPEASFIAEDLGYVSTKHVDKPLIKLNLPGMRCFQWFHIPKYANIAKYPPLCFAMTSNHDMESLPSWWSKLKQSRKEIFYRQLDEKPAQTPEDQVYQLTHLLFNSEACVASITLRDLSFDERRYNKPGQKNSQNWTTRMHKNLEEVDFTRIEDIIAKSNRAH